MRLKLILLILVISVIISGYGGLCNRNKNAQNNNPAGKNVSPAPWDSRTSRTLAPTSWWSNSYGGSLDDWANSIQITNDNGCIVAGSTESFGASSSDCWVIKLDVNGLIQWQKMYGGKMHDMAYSIQQTTDGGYIMAGRTDSFGAGKNDAWILKLDNAGGIEWQKTYGGPLDDWVNSIQQTTDGGYIAAGRTASFGAGGLDCWVLKLKSNGEIEWQKTYGGTSDDWATAIQQTSDGGYVIAGNTQSFGQGAYDAWILKLNRDGTIDWQKTCGGIKNDWAKSIKQTSDGGYIVAGSTESFGLGGYDSWALKLNSSGTVEWQKKYGGPQYDMADSVQQTPDGGYILAGRTASFGAGNYDAWVIKLNSAGAILWQKAYGDSNDSWVNTIQLTSDGWNIMAGMTDSLIGEKNDAWVVKLDNNGKITFDSNSRMNTANTGAVPVDTTAKMDVPNIKNGNTTVSPVDTKVTPVNTYARARSHAP